MLLDFDRPDLWKKDFPVFDADRWIALQFLNLGIGEGVIAVIALEAWEAGGLAFLASFEECFERFIYSLQGVLQDLRVDLIVLRSDLFDCGELGRLVIVGETHMAHPGGFTAVLKRCVVQLTIAIKRELESIALLARGVQAIRKSFD